MPPRLQPIVQALSEHSSNLDLGAMIGGSTEPVEVATLVQLARACREERQITCSYRRHNGEIGERRLEPLHLVATMGRWYLVAYCLAAGAWRTFRVDRVGALAVTNKPRSLREPPATDLHKYVAAQVGAGWQQVTATVRVHAPRHAVARWILPAWGTVTEETPQTCIVEAGADTYEALARWLILLDAHLTVIAPPELRTAFAELAAGISHIADGS